MTYLFYIIDHYQNLSDVNIFMHWHRHSWHHNELLSLDAVEMAQRLSAERVQREEYMNMRRHWEPGCPDWMHPSEVNENVNKREESVLENAWSELFPFDDVPAVLAQPCCAPFAVSKERIRNLPLVRYIFYRNWLLKTKLPDYIRRRVWECRGCSGKPITIYFHWENIHCPKEHICDCDGYGVYFGSEDEYKHYFDKHHERKRLENELNNWREQTQSLTKELKGKSRETEIELLKQVGRDIELEGKINGIKA
ncbi:hypothetical protein B0O99DRAFT_708508 [Bisporella sp. PMI_857]|nr:hypothetical protein B0O99DRAFT_708508 [Bisporella sp. PMI_857]